MKERNFQRKQALKAVRQKRVRKKNLHHDISIFMIKWCLRVCHDPHNEYSRVLGDGFKGFHNMRGRELIKRFEAVYAYVRDPKNIESLLLELKNSWGQRTRSHMELYVQRDQKIIHEDLMLETDSLMSRLMELAFDLDVEE